ncbi:efflux RND transporter periplasmic adaptor subunit [Pedobacter xixiisoli]|uniref:Membrane fusion protein, multidrug efflux system n=1 Tax=Pedobacter xixiisoli TaxID=1476464 RepID=A0A285ZUI2_9SPHI|nr:efflux RND transporter periplasmic adaptor subunit [Pedobacter xixiisoli]SOD13315.1 membrane fusion protein, multidrug efflux system [Pedobacter xixiisoli]
MVQKHTKEKGAYWLILAVSLVFAACGQAPQGYEVQPVNTDFITLGLADAAIEKRYPGMIEGTVNVEVKAQVTGYLEAIYVKEGDYVTKGQSLFKIKGDVFNEQVNNSQATLKSALAAQATAKIEVEKIKPLVAGKVVSDIQLKTAEANYDAATAQVAQAKAALGSSQINADFAVIKAPVSGYIGRIPNRIGNLVTPADPTPLTTLSEIDQVFVYFSMSEADFIAFNKDRKTDAGMNSVSLITADGETYAHKGKLELASGNIERSTGSIALKAVFPNPDKLLRSGGAGRVIVTKQVKEALTLPMASVKDVQDKFFVFALADSSKVAMKAIEIEGRTGDKYIVKSGIAKGEKIAINSIDALSEGQKVVPTMVTK